MNKNTFEKVTLAKGEVGIYGFGAVKLHAYKTNDPMDDEVFIVEKGGRAVVIGAGAGLSASAGFTYDGERFHRYFADLEEKYGFHDMYSGGFYPYKTPEEYRGFWSRYILINRYEKTPKPVYETLRNLIKDKDYFVITTNVDHCFQKAGFEKKRLFYTQGDYGLFQCSEPCCRETRDNEAEIRRMVREQRDGKIPTELIPVCPHCGKPAGMNLRTDDRFVEDEGWHAAKPNGVLFPGKSAPSAKKGRHTPPFFVFTGQFRCRICVIQFRCSAMVHFSLGETEACK